MNKQIIIIKPGSLKPKDKEKLTKAGNIVIECEEGYKIIYHTMADTEGIKFLHVNCAQCGDRIYMTNERLFALQKGNESFYCTRGHSNKFKKSTPL